MSIIHCCSEEKAVNVTLVCMYPPISTGWEDFQPTTCQKEKKRGGKGVYQLAERRNVSMTERQKRTVHAAKSISAHRIQPVFVTNHNGTQQKKKKKEMADSLAGVAFLFLVIFSVSLWIRFVVVGCTYTKSRCV